jgi:hypothetical protein
MPVRGLRLDRPDEQGIARVAPQQPTAPRGGRGDRQMSSQEIGYYLMWFAALGILYSMWKFRK